MLKVVSTEKALEIIRDEFSHLKSEGEKVLLHDALGRTVYENILSDEFIPSFNRSTVDGYAVIASDTYGSSESIPSQLEIIGEIPMGEAADIAIHNGECVKISTGGMLPEGADSVVMVEHTDTSFHPLCLIQKSVSPFQNVVRKGDDIKQKDIILQKGKLISSRETGVLACAGVNEICVAKKPKIGIISTGDEIVPVDSELTFGKIRDINSHLLRALMLENGCEVTLYGIIKDSYDEIKSSVKKAVDENDIVLISGGSSAGTRDMTAEIISSMGEVFIHGIAIKPGKPTIIGKISEKAVFGLPGHPVAAYFVALLFVCPLIESMLSAVKEKTIIKGRLTQNISSNHGREEILCVRQTSEGISPVLGKSGIITLLTGSDGYVIIDRNCEGLKQGEETEVFLF